MSSTFSTPGSDPQRSVANAPKAGILSIPLLYHSNVVKELNGLRVRPVSDELRWVVIGKMNEKHWSAVITRRSDNVRIISVRRSRDEEIEIYESQDI